MVGERSFGLQPVSVLTHAHWATCQLGEDLEGMSQQGLGLLNMGLSQKKLGEVRR